MEIKKEIKFDENYIKMIDDTKYLNWKKNLEEKHELSRQYHATSPVYKPAIKRLISALEIEIMSAPEEYWQRYVKERGKK